MGRRLAPCVFAVAFFAAAPDAHAQNQDAVKHFTEGKRLRDDGNCAAAITEFKASLKTEESVGAYYNLGFCFEQLGQKQEAFINYRRARQIAESKKDERTGEIAGAVASLELRSEYVRLFLPKSLPKGFKIRVDDELVPENLYDVETTFFTKKPAPPHEVLVTAPGYEDRKLQVESKSPVPIELRTTSLVVTAPPPPPKVEEDTGGWHWQRWLGLGIGVAGLGAFVYGAVEGISYLNDRSDLDDRLKEHPCSETGLATCRDDAERALVTSLADENNKLVEKEGSARVRSLVPLIAGVVAMGGGAVLFFTAPKGKSQPERGSLHLVPVFGKGQQGLSLSGAF